MRKHLFPILVFCILAGINCSKEHRTEDIASNTNPAACITDSQKLQMLHSIKNLSDGELYELNYTVDYKLDLYMQSDVSDILQFLTFVSSQLLDSPTATKGISIPAFGCSMFAAEMTESGDFMLGRNFDFLHVNSSGGIQEISRILVRTAPEGGKRSIGITDGVFFGYGKGAISDDTTDISLLMAAPYAVLDGINEDGLAAGILFLDGNPALQNNPGKNHLWATSLIRLILDKASTVSEAEKLVEQYNLSMSVLNKGSYHFLIADAEGDYAIIEISYGENQNVKTDMPDVLHFFHGDAYRYVTNFYVDPRMANESIGGLSNHGRKRYDTMKDTLQVKSYHLTEQEAKTLLETVSQTSDPNDPTSETQWSAVYNLTGRTMDLAVHRKYEQWFSFSI